MNAICRALELFCLFPAKILVRLLVVLEWKLTATNHSKAHQVFTCFRIDPSWTFPVEAIALSINRKPNKEFDLQMTGSQEILFWYGRTIISLQFFINLIRRKYFRIQASMNTGTLSEQKLQRNLVLVNDLFKSKGSVANCIKATSHSTIFNIPMHPVREDQRHRRRFTR